MKSSYKIAKLILLVIVLTCINLFPKTFVNPVFGDKIIDLSAKIGRTLNEIRKSIGEIITNAPPIQITQPGYYVLSENINGPISIASDNVQLDLNGYEVYDDVGTSTLITIGGFNDISIFDGSVRGAGSSIGIAINQGASLVKLDNINITDFDTGILLDGTTTGTIKACLVKNCSLFYNTKGVVGHYLIKTIFDNCDARNCLEVGFELENSSYNVFYRCKALEIANDQADKNAIGFSSAAGIGNLFQECIVEGVTKSVSDNDYNAIGFLLTGKDNVREIKSEIVDCIGNVIENILNLNSYGIYLKSFFIPASDNFIYLLDSYDYGNPEFSSVDWHPSGNYLAVGRQTLANEPEVRVLFFNGESLSELPTATYEHNNVIFPVRWHPNGQFLAIGGVGDPNLLVLAFDEITQTLSEISTATYAYPGGAVFSLDWHQTGSFLAIGGQNNAGPDVQILSFDINTQVLSEISTATYEYDGTVWSVDWHPNEKFLGVGGQSFTGPEVVRVLDFDINTQTLSEITTASYIFSGSRIASLDWHPTGSYLAISGSSDTEPDVQVLEFDQTTEILSEIITATYEYGNPSPFIGNIMVNWNPDGTYLAIVGPKISGPEVRILEFDLPSEVLSAITTATYEHGESLASVRFSQDGTILAISGEQSPNDSKNVRVFSFLKEPQPPINCTIKNNEVANCSGIGISGNGTENLITRNISYNNIIHYAGPGINTISMFTTPPINPNYNVFY